MIKSTQLGDQAIEIAHDTDELIGEYIKLLTDQDVIEGMSPEELAIIQDSFKLIKKCEQLMIDAYENQDRIEHKLDKMIKLLEDK